MAIDFLRTSKPTYNIFFMGVCFRILFMNGTDHIDAFKPVDRPAHADDSRLQPGAGTLLNLLPSHRV